MKIANINAGALNAAAEILFETGASATCWHTSEATGLARSGYSGLHIHDLADGCLVAIADDDADCGFTNVAIITITSRPCYVWRLFRSASLLPRIYCS